MKGKRFKRFLCALGSVSILSLFGACQNIVDANNWFEYTLLEDGTYEVSLKREIAGIDAEDWILDNVTEVRIPAKYKGKPVTAIAENAFYACQSLVSVEIPDSVTTIGDSAFSNCGYLEELKFGNSITTIGVCAFRECDELVSLEIPETVTSIGQQAFYNCRDLASITMNGQITSIGRDAFTRTAYYKDETNWVDEVLYIGTTLVEAKVTLSGECIVKEGTLCIADDAFDDCANSISVVLPASLIAIGNRALCCPNLTNIRVDGNNRVYESIDGNLYTHFQNGNGILLQYALGKRDSIFKVFAAGIGDYAFNNCNSLSHITIGPSVTSIGNYAFRGCDELTDIEVMGSALTSIGDDAFAYCLKLQTVTIPDSVTSLGSNIYAGCSELKTVWVGKSVEVISDGAFSLCENLTSIEVDDENPNYKAVDGNLYTKDGTTFVQYATGKKGSTLSIPDSVTTIGGHAFAHCKSLVSVIIPNSVTTIEDCAFWHCTSLWKVIIGNSVTTIGVQAFGNCTILSSVKLPASLTTIKNHAFYCCESLTSVTIPANVKSIGKGAFESCSALTSVVFENPNGWWYSTVSWATSGPKLSSLALADTATAAKYLKFTHKTHYLGRI